MFRYLLTAAKRPHRAGAVGVALALVAGLSTSAVAETADAPRARAPRPPAVAQPAKPAPGGTVTLVTGDRVRVDAGPRGAQALTVLPPAGGKDTAGGGFAQFIFRGDQYVIPAEAGPYLGRTLDPRLFNVSYLLRAKLDDRRTGTLPVRIEATAARAEDLPATSVTGTAGGHARAKVAKKDAGRLGRTLAERWRGGAAHPAGIGTLPGIDRITLAPPKGAPALPEAPAQAAPLSAATKPTGVRNHNLTVNSIDFNGQPGNIIGWAHNVEDANVGFFLMDFPGRQQATFSVPEGTYAVEATVLTGPGDKLSSPMAFVTEPEFTVKADTTVTLDARKAVPYQPTVDDPGAQGLQRTDSLWFSRTSEAGNGNALHPFGFTGFALIQMRLIAYPSKGSPMIFATPTRPVTKGSFDLAAYTYLRENVDTVPEQPTSLPTYMLGFSFPGGVPASMSPKVRSADLTTLHSKLYQRPGTTGMPHQMTSEFSLPWTMGRNWAWVKPGERTDYVYGNTPDTTVWQQRDLITDDGDFQNVWGERRKVRPGQVISEKWNQAPRVFADTPLYRVSPAVGFGTSDTLVTSAVAMDRICAACRQDNIAMVNLGLGYSEPTHVNEAFPQVDKDLVSAEFYRDGALAFTTTNASTYLGPSGMPLPLVPRAATYRLKARQEYGTDAQMSVTSDWTFRSGPADTAATLPDKTDCTPDPSRGCSFLPMLFIRYGDLGLDLNSQAKAGAPLDIAFSVRHQQSQSPPSGVTATVEVSYDDGETWSEPRDAARRGDGSFATTVQHPALSDPAQYVSLRIIARDDAGNSVTQTNSRAYRLTD
ncbi:hypothetical protein [Spirillospora sp. NBC_01491]|uniref:hypothetical protein n=1 Tax=Spirillospora sp. NBC_01491 TaxID=2976007 RepID=UPI002E2F6602|nr:hypothetical protein [Spirillospora sp. NBC_01491]